MSEAPAGLTPHGRRFLLGAGIAMVAVGLAMEIGGFFWFGYAGFAWVESFGSGPPPFLAMLFMLLGGLVLMVGLILLVIGAIRPVSRLMAAEAAPALETQAHAMARAVSKAFPVVPGTAAVRVRCRSCGFLESEEAKFCSRCRAAM